MIPITIIIQRKTLVPTKRAIVHAFRSDWIPVNKITAFESYEFFKKITTDALFSKYIVDNFGPGIYSCIGFPKKRRGCIRFLQVECKENSYIRLKRKLTAEQEENKKLLFEKRRIERRLKQDGEKMDHEVKEGMKDEINLYESLLDTDNEAAGFGGCYPYLRSVQPVYKEHDYSEEPRNVIRNKKIEISKQTNNVETNNVVEEVSEESYSML